MTGFLQTRGFQNVPPENLQAVFFKMEEIKTTAGEVIIKQGAEDDDYFYIIAGGSVDVVREAESLGKSVKLAMFGPGACFGEDSLISGNPRNATVVMRTDGKLMRLHKNDFFKLLRDPLAKKLKPEKVQEVLDKGAAWVDVRMPPEANKAPLAGAMRIPFPLMRSRLTGFEADKPYIVACKDGRDSSVAAFIMAKVGLDAYFLDKGLDNWHPDQQEQAQP